MDKGLARHFFKDIQIANRILHEEALNIIEIIRNANQKPL